MKLERIRLHPFGGTYDRTLEFGPGLNVICGPNEAGKTTLRTALQHALFTISPLTPAKRRTQMGRWFPRPDGDHTSVTLDFAVGGKTWSLDKTWGAGAHSKLTSGDGGVFQDPEQVQARIEALLKWNEATWRHVLFTEQAEFARTIDVLSKASKDLDDVRAHLSGADLLAGDIPEDQLREALQARIDEHFSRWDRTAAGPERGRGLNNPWKKSVGLVLEAYYAHAEMLQRRNDSLAYEQGLDALNAQIAEHTRTIEKHQAFVAEGRNIRDGLSRRRELEAVRRGAADRQAELKQVMQDWPKVAHTLEVSAAERHRLQESDGRLQEELKAANAREEGNHVRKAAERVAAARDKYERAREAVQAAQEPQPNAVEAVVQHAKEVMHLEAQLQAQSLAVQVESDRGMNMTVSAGHDEPFGADLVPGVAWEGTASGRVQLDLGDCRVTVASAQLDVEECMSALGRSRAARDEILAAHGCADIAALEALAKNFEALTDDAKRLEASYQAELEGHDQDWWDERVRQLDQLPQTRDKATIESERDETRTQIAKLDAACEQGRRQVESWEAKFESEDRLLEDLVAAKEELKRAEDGLRDSPSLPEGFETVDQYLQELQARDDKLRTAERMRAESQNELVGLEARAPEYTVQELEPRVAAAQRAFERRLHEGQAYERILATLDRICDSSANDPLADLATQIGSSFTQLTAGRYQQVTFDRLVPTEVHGDAVVLAPNQLSQGTLGSLALAVRLGMGDAYLKGMDGFACLDDPFVELDPTRRQAAVDMLQSFAAEHQVILLTCHPEHADQLTQSGGTRIDL